MIENIIVFEDSSKAKFGGGQQVTLEVLASLYKNYNLIIVDCNKKSIFQDKAKSYTSKIIKLSCNGKVVGGDKASFGLGYKEIALFPFIFIKNTLTIIKYLKSNKLNKQNTIIYATTKKNLLLACILNMIIAIEYIYHAHSFDDRNSIFYKIINPAYKKATKIICVSNLIKDNINLPNCQTIYNPIQNINAQVKDIQNKSKIIVASFSTLIKLKGIEYFMKSFDYLKNKNKVEYWIFGDGQEQEYLRQFTNKKVILKGFSSNSEKLMLEEICIVVVPSIVEEACPMVPLEAFKCGIPVISTNIGGQAEIVKDNEVGLFVDIMDSEQIAIKIDFLIDNTEIYNRFSYNTLKYSKTFNMFNYSKTITKIFKDIK
jgi:glycosyltransferase involved in cell wall biosynthesis